MAIYEREQISTILRRLDEKPQRLIIITGPRQTGKTTLIRQVLVQINRRFEYLSVDEPEPVEFFADSSFTDVPTTFPKQVNFPISDTRDTRWLVNHWEQARVNASREEQGFVLAIDEIQKIPNWSETVKGLWDADRRYDYPLHVVLLGSAPLLMQRGMSESLAGRFETIHLTHWSFAEMSAAFDFDLFQYVYFGGYPGAPSALA